MTKHCTIFQKQWFEQQFISSDKHFIKICVWFYVCSHLKSLLTVVQFAKSSALSPTLYKFIVLGSLGSYPNSLGLGLKNVSLQESNWPYYLQHTLHQHAWKEKHFIHFSFMSLSIPLLSPLLCWIFTLPSIFNLLKDFNR